MTARPVVPAPVVECAGLPGAGKTSICRKVEPPHFGKGAVRLLDTRLGRAAIPLTWNVFMLCLSIRPFRWKRLVRAFNLIIFLRHYGRHARRPMLLDQGLVQKLWSMLIESRSYSRRRLHRVMARLRPFAPDHVVWIATSLPVAARRIADRTHGNSRFDRLALEETVARLAPRAALLEELAILFQKSTGTPLWRLDGENSPVENALSISNLLQGRSPLPGGERSPALAHRLRADG